MAKNIIKKGTFILWIFLGIIVFFSSFKEQIVLNKRFQQQISYIFPEGWGFFTKNPRDLLMDVYRIKNGELRKIDMSNHSLKNKLGLSREARIIGYESSLVANDIPQNIWKKGVSQDITNIINDSGVTIIQKKYFKHIISGEYIFKL